MTFRLQERAERLASVIHEIAQWSKSHPNARRYASGYLKLPPVFAGGKHGHDKHNLTAMIKTLGDYEDGRPDGTFPTLAELPAIYNGYGGAPHLTERDMRKVHNWMQQVSFGVRAAMLKMEEREPSDLGVEMNVPDRVHALLYASNPRRAFVTFSPDNRYELKPLRYADDEAKRRWLREEYAQMRGGRMVTASAYGARPSQAEWDLYGLRGQMRTVFASMREQIGDLIRRAAQLDGSGDYDEADDMDARLLALSANLENFERWGDLSASL